GNASSRREGEPPGVRARAVEELRGCGVEVTDEHLRHLSPLGWEHIALTGVYRWNLDGAPRGNMRPLRS
ncbi:MAG: transposase, partial [Actinomycetota bacterium]|nr:transposase [Actinomycetota bacterium]